MNYSKSYRLSDVAKRVAMLCAVVGVISLLVGGVCGYALKTHISHKTAVKTDGQATEQDSGHVLVYGAYDSRIMDGQTADWFIGDLPFEPLQCGLEGDVQEFVYYMSDGYNIDFTLVMALIQKESEFDPDAISPTNDYGLMQINKVNHEWVTEATGVTDYLDPYENIRAGLFILRKLFERYQEPELVLMAYHMGETGAARLWEKGVFRTPYTEQVLNYQRDFQEQLGGGNR